MPKWPIERAAPTEGCLFSQCNLREILTNLRVAMDPQGLVHAVQVLATEFRQRAGIPLQLQCELP